MANIQLPEWAECLFDEDARYFAIVGGRGSSKSRSVCTSLVLRASQKPLRILCTREIQNSIKDSVKRLLDDEIERLDLNHLFDSTDNEIRCSNGSLFLFAGLRSNINSIKSMEGIDVCWVEEAQTVSRNSLNTLIPTIRKPKSQCVFTWNPHQPTDPIDEMFCGEIKPPKTIFKRVNFIDNPWFPDVLREEMEFDKKRDHDKYLHVWLGEYNNKSEARVYKNWIVEEFERPAGTIYRFGADWGFANDPTALIRCSIDENRLYIDYEAVMVGCEIVNTPDLFRRIPESDKWFITADSSRPETISHMMHNGFPKINGSVKGKGSVEDGVEFLKSFDIVVHPRCVETIRELTTYSYKTDPLTDRILPVLEDKNNHIMDALRYACEGIRNVRKKKERKVGGYIGSGSWM